MNLSIKNVLLSVVDPSSYLAFATNPVQAAKFHRYAVYQVFGYVRLLAGLISWSHPAALFKRPCISKNIKISEIILFLCLARIDIMSTCCRTQKSRFILTTPIKKCKLTKPPMSLSAFTKCSVWLISGKCYKNWVALKMCLRNSVQRKGRYSATETLWKIQLNYCKRQSRLRCLVKLKDSWRKIEDIYDLSVWVGNCRALMSSLEIHVWNWHRRRPTGNASGGWHNGLTNTMMVMPVCFQCSLFLYTKSP